MGTVPIRLPLWPTTKVQVAMSFSNLAVPAIGGTAVQVRFLQKQGIGLAGAVRPADSSLRSPASSPSACSSRIALLLSPTGVDLGPVPTDGLDDIALAAVCIAVLVTVIVLRVPRVRRVVAPPMSAALTTIGAALRSPRRVAMLLAGNVLVSILYAACLLLCVKAYGSDVSFWSLLAVNIGIGTIAPLVPVPGGGTALSVLVSRARSHLRRPRRCRHRRDPHEPARRELPPGGRGPVPDTRSAEAGSRLGAHRTRHA